uniref:Uncharacterized protein n=1 Tax=Avena sativa TaxID=4498 RepID=A0ACD5UH46_AVESA
MMTIDEFEAAWEHLVGEYGLTGNTYMMQVFDCRDKWAKPYFKNQFCAKMTSTQRNECMNHVLKTYVSRSAPLNRFFMQYTKLIADRCGEEDAAQAHTKQVVKSLRAGVPIENHAYKVYTHAMFLIFSDILYKSGSFMVRGPPEGGTVVLEHFDAERRSKYFKVRYEVDVDLVRSEFKCECGLFEHTGMLCRHVLKAMVHYGVSQIPSRYIIKRWTRNARDVLPEDIRCYQRDSETGVSKTYRHNVLYMKALEIVKLGDVSLETFAVAMRNLDNTKKKLIEESEKIISSEKGAPSTGHCTESESNVQDNGSTQPRGFADTVRVKPVDMDGEELHNEIEENTDVQPAVRDVYKAPENRPSRGRPVTRRMQSRSERAKGKGKEKAVCAICGSEEHEMTNCPAMEVEPYTEFSGNDSLSGRPDGAAEADEIDSNQAAGLDDTPTVRHTPKTTSRRDSSSAKPRGGKAKPPSAPRRCKICGDVGHYAPKCPQNDQERAPVASPVCKTCGLSGHMSNTCGRQSTYKRK